MKTRVVLALAAGLFLVNLGPLFACSICDGGMKWCNLDPDGYEFCTANGVNGDNDGDNRPDETPLPGTFCVESGRQCEGWIPKDCTDSADFWCWVLSHAKYDPCSHNGGSNAS